MEMDMKDYQELGQVFKSFRKNRNIPLKQLASPEVSLSQLSRFERGESDISLSKFLVALDNMHVEVKEFIDHANDYHHTEQINFMSELIDLEYKRDVQEFQAMLDKEKAKYSQHPEVYRYYLNTILLQGFICKCDDKIPFPQNYVNDLSDYLFTTERWDIYELILIGNLYLYIDIPLLDQMGREIIKRRHFYEEIATHKHLVTMTLLNIWETCLHRKALQVAPFYQTEAAKLIENETKLYEKTIYLFLSGLQTYLEGSIIDGIESMRQAIQIFDWLGCDNLAKNYQHDLAKFVHYNL